MNEDPTSRQRPIAAVVGQIVIMYVAPCVLIASHELQFASWLQNRRESGFAMRAAEAGPTRLSSSTSSTYTACAHSALFQSCVAYSSYRFTMHVNYRFVPVEQKEPVCRMNHKVKDHSYSVGFAQGDPACTRLSYFPLQGSTQIRSAVLYDCATSWHAPAVPVPPRRSPRAPDLVRNDVTLDVQISRLAQSMYTHA
jgi:hypothetical protein